MPIIKDLPFNMRRHKSLHLAAEIPGPKNLPSEVKGCPF